MKIRTVKTTAWTNVEKAAFNEACNDVFEAIRTGKLTKSRKPETEAQTIARERNREHRGESRHARRFEY